MKIEATLLRWLSSILGILGVMAAAAGFSIPVRMIMLKRPWQELGQYTWGLFWYRILFSAVLVVISVFMARRAERLQRQADQQVGRQERTLRK